MLSQAAGGVRVPRMSSTTLSSIRFGLSAELVFVILNL